MTYLKAISGHTGAGGIRRYLERGGRALAADLINLGDPELCENWAAAMDRTRGLAGNDAPWGGRPARTFKHYVVSPSPDDRVSLEDLRVLATRWASRCFPDFEVAIVYYHDNRGHVPHAHVVVNNTSLDTGRRLQDPDPGALNGALQEESRGMGCRTSGAGSTAVRGTTGDTRGGGRQEREISSRGGYSWVADIRARVSGVPLGTREPGGDGSARLVEDRRGMGLPARRDDVASGVRHEARDRIHQRGRDCANGSDTRGRRV